MNWLYLHRLVYSNDKKTKARGKNVTQFYSSEEFKMLLCFIPALFKLILDFPGERGKTQMLHDCNVPLT